jgi:hypothetical protein
MAMGHLRSNRWNPYVLRYLRIIMRQGFNGEGDDGRGGFQPNQLRVNGLI